MTKKIKKPKDLEIDALKFQASDYRVFVLQNHIQGTQLVFSSLCAFSLSKLKRLNTWLTNTIKYLEQK